MRKSTQSLVLSLAIALLVVLTPAADAGSMADFTFTIKKDCHNSTNHLFGTVAMNMCVKPDRALSFKVLFPSSTPYATQAPANQWDWNKLMGISTALIHKNSIRLGWRWNPTKNKVDLGYYGYIKGNRTMPEITSVDLNQWVDVRITMTKDGESVTVNGIKHEVKSPLGFSTFFPTPTWILKTAYFGGDEMAPHEFKIQIKDVTCS